MTSFIGDTCFFCNEKKCVCKHEDVENYRCKHGKYKYRCKNCKGSQICKHGKYKYRCLDCKGSQICKHGKNKYRCLDCKGSQICEHGKIKYKCLECKGSQICEHGKIKYTCLECKGSQICEHGRIKYTCLECKDYSYSYKCEHGKHKYRCKDCKGSQICVHNIIKYRCKECDGSDLCKSEWCFTVKNLRYEGYCLRCYLYLFPDTKLPRNYKTKENTVVNEIKHTFPDKTWIFDKKINYGCSLRRPDVFLDLGSHVLIVEIDEYQHHEISRICENKRIMELSKDVHHRPIIFIRFNPDSYTKSDGTMVKSPWHYNKHGYMTIRDCHKNEWQYRIQILLERIRYWIEHTNTQTIQKEELFYNYT
jgi:hypothetical protein